MQRLVRVLDEDRYPVADRDEQDGSEGGKRLPKNRKDEHRGDDAGSGEQMVVYDAVKYWMRGERGAGAHEYIYPAEHEPYFAFNKTM